MMLEKEKMTTTTYMKANVLNHVQLCLHEILTLIGVTIHAANRSITAWTANKNSVGVRNSGFLNMITIIKRLMIVEMTANIKRNVA